MSSGFMNKKKKNKFHGHDYKKIAAWQVNEIRKHGNLKLCEQLIVYTALDESNDIVVGGLCSPSIFFSPNEEVTLYKALNLEETNVNPEHILALENGLRITPESVADIKRQWAKRAPGQIVAIVNDINAGNVSVYTMGLAGTENLN